LGWRTAPNNAQARRAGRVGNFNQGEHGVVMESAAVWRMDGVIEQTRRVKVIWAWRFASGSQEGLPEEGLILMVNLIRAADCRSLVHREGMTHEITVYEVDPLTPIDYKKSLFEQKNVSPLVPTTIGFQFPADSNDDAIDRITALLQCAIAEDWPADIVGVWEKMFSDGVRIPTQVQYEVAVAMAASG
jgi:hypothetical protein